ncbi:dihydrofolate reductase family protein [Mesorhizobium sp. CA7]|uniref:dihydrofolate reductase family protein n=1 Tax=Mesorhizobium sp. CA7 TaxID=588501 RepID=UPI001CCCD9DC|nr:dihydrofolate reductase family protein [Mesorhizobium sp. CA7]MBZ9816809.1 dihydrofolate reductase family protein [Mesorhizobium sp. CA7]
MRKLIVTEFITIDGIAEHERLPNVAWTDEMQAFKEDELADSGAMLLGRVTYEIFAGHWPAEKGDFADRFNALPKYVASATLKAVDWHPAELLEGPLTDAVTRLKQRSGGNIYVHGSVNLARQLLGVGLVDTLRLLVYPAAAGQGERLFPSDKPTALELVSAVPFSNGVVAMEYRAVAKS